MQMYKKGRAEIAVETETIALRVYLVKWYRPLDTL